MQPCTCFIKFEIETMRRRRRGVRAHPRSSLALCPWPLRVSAQIGSRGWSRGQRRVSLIHTHKEEEAIEVVPSYSHFSSTRARTWCCPSRPHIPVSLPVWRLPPTTTLPHFPSPHTRFTFEQDTVHLSVQMLSGPPSKPNQLQVIILTL